MRPALAFRSLSLIWFTLSLALLSLSHHSHPGTGKSFSELEKGPSPAVFERFHCPHDLASLQAIDEPENNVRLVKRGAIRVMLERAKKMPSCIMPGTTCCTLSSMCTTTGPKSILSSSTSIFTHFTFPKSSKLRPRYCKWLNKEALPT